jgi:hypothetical protein
MKVVDLLKTDVLKTHVLRRCEICGAMFVEGYGYSLMASWVVTGHAYIGGYSCEHSTAIPGNQHWGCTPEHALQATLNCLQHNEHLSVSNLKARHKKEQEKGHTRYSDADASWAAGQGDNFHIIEE